jgi:uncharacterized membrane protein
VVLRAVRRRQPGMCLAQVVVLGLPTAIGASAGRLLLQSK